MIARSGLRTRSSSQHGLIIDLLKRLDKLQAVPISPALRAQLSRYRMN